MPSTKHSIFDGVRFLRIVYLYAHYQSVYDDPIDHLSISYKNYLLIVCVCANDTDHTTVYHHHHIWKASIGRLIGLYGCPYYGSIYCQ